MSRDGAKRVRPVVLVDEWDYLGFDEPQELLSSAGTGTVARRWCHVAQTIGVLNADDYRVRHYIAPNLLFDQPGHHRVLRVMGVQHINNWVSRFRSFVVCRDFHQDSSVFADRLRLY